ncbi:MAG: YeeE/YedE family protein [Alphaproteobacteria bacterium]|jgi:uncharacterized membrane protein YedE/YeeE|nr:YeeE/YedE family protein [Alphaproteobacteria bacterium]
MDLGSGSALAAVSTVLFGIGAAFGVIAERSAVCTMGAVADVVLFGGRRRARLWAGALATAMLALHALAMAGWFSPTAALAWRAQAPGLAVAGGVVFGVGMVAAGGCVSRAWIRAASGSLKALAVVAAAAAGIAIAVPLLPLGGPPAPAAGPPAVAGLALGLVLAVWVLRGGLVALAHVASAPLAADGIRFVVPLALALDGAPGAALPGLAVLAGTAVGAGLGAARGGRWRSEPWGGVGDGLRHVAGGVAMGVGGTLALGCTVGAGIGGVAVLAPAAWLALAGMVVGATIALKLMLVGGPSGAWRRVRRRLAGGT